MSLPPFHLAIQVRNVAEARQFYGEIIGCSEGRSTDVWCDLNFYGHQLVVHLNTEIGISGKVSHYHTSVDSEQVPIPHFGVVLSMDQWKLLADRLRKHAVNFIIEPTIRFKGLVGEQATLFIKDPSGNTLEFKAFKNLDALFAS